MINIKRYEKSKIKIIKLHKIISSILFNFTLKKVDNYNILKQLINVCFDFNLSVYTQKNSIKQKKHKKNNLSEIQNLSFQKIIIYIVSRFFK